MSAWRRMCPRLVLANPRCRHTFGLKGCFHDLLQQKNTLHVRWVGDTGQHEAVACTPLHDFEAQSLCFEARLTTGIIACVAQKLGTRICSKTLISTPVGVKPRLMCVTTWRIDLPSGRCDRHAQRLLSIVRVSSYGSEAERAWTSHERLVRFPIVLVLLSSSWKGSQSGL